VDNSALRRWRAQRLNAHCDQRVALRHLTRAASANLSDSLRWRWPWHRAQPGCFCVAAAQPGCLAGQLCLSSGCWRRWRSPVPLLCGPALETSALAFDVHPDVTLWPYNWCRRLLRVLVSGISYRPPSYPLSHASGWTTRRCSASRGLSLASQRRCPPSQPVALRSRQPAARLGRQPSPHGRRVTLPACGSTR